MVKASSAEVQVLHLRRQRLHRRHHVHVGGRVHVEQREPLEGAIQLQVGRDEGRFACKGSDEIFGGVARAKFFPFWVT